MKKYGLLTIYEDELVDKKYYRGKFVSNDNLEYEVLISI